MFEKYEKAGKIAAKVRDQAAKKATAGMKVSDLVDFVEGSILETGAGLSFPCNVSINEMAAHYTSAPGDDTLLCEGDIVKIDKHIVKVHVIKTQDRKLTSGFARANVIKRVYSKPVKFNNYDYDLTKDIFKKHKRKKHEGIY